MDERELNFVQEAASASMITLRANGTPHATRVGVSVVDGKAWSSGTQSRLRMRHLRCDPRSTLFVFDTAPEKNWRWLTLESTPSLGVYQLGSARASFDITDGVKVLNHPYSNNLNYLEDLSVDDFISHIKQLATTGEVSAQPAR